MKKIFIKQSLCLLLVNAGNAQSPTFKTYVNPVIPGDHSDCTLSKVGNVYLKFKGSGTGKLFMLQWLSFVDNSHSEKSVGGLHSKKLPGYNNLSKNYPNPFQPTKSLHLEFQRVLAFP